MLETRDAMITGIVRARRSHPGDAQRPPFRRHRLAARRSLDR